MTLTGSRKFVPELAEAILAVTCSTHVRPLSPSPRLSRPQLRFRLSHPYSHGPKSQPHFRR
jgi:hypothetical protein